MDTKDKLEYIKHLDVINLYHLNKSSLPPEVAAAFEKNYDFLYFTFNVSLPFITALPGKVHKLMMKQFPAFRKETRPSVLKELESITTAVGVELVIGLSGIIKNKSEGKTTRDYLAPFEEWVKNNAYPEDSWEEIKENERGNYGINSDEEWLKIKEEENLFHHFEFVWVKRSRFECIELLKNLLLTYFKGFEFLEAEDLIVYSILLRKEYEDYNEFCEEIEDFIDWGLPEDDMSLSFSERIEKQIALGSNKRREVAEMRYRRVYGEDI